MKLGFLTRQDAKLGGRPQRGGSITSMSDEDLARLGPKAVRSMNPSAKHPEMEPDGAAAPLLYVLGECPTEQDDVKGKPFSGAVGRRLRKMMSAAPQGKTRYNYLVRTCPPQDRSPNRVEVECFRQSVIEDIAATQPRVILAVGPSVIKWFIGTKWSISQTRGRAFATWMGDHPVWVCPIYDPAAMLVQERSNDHFERRKAEEAGKLLRLDIAKAVRLAKSGTPAEPLPSDAASLDKGIRLLDGSSSTHLDQACRLMRSLADKPTISIDIETFPFRVYDADSKLLTVAVGNSSKVVAFAVDHPGSKFTKAGRAQLLKHLRKLLMASGKRWAHNTSFELEWLMTLLGPEVGHNPDWHDTMQQQYVLDERRGTHGLDFCCIEWLGVPLKSLSQLDRSRLCDYPVGQVLRYNALDTKYTHHLQRRLGTELKARGLADVYDFQRRRVLPVTCAQLQGVPIDQEEVKQLHHDNAKRLNKLKRKIQKSPNVKKFVAKAGAFNPDSPEQVSTLLGKEMGILKPNKQGKVSTSESAIKGRCREADVILEIRRAGKFLGTYVEPLMAGSDKTLVWPDGKIHTNFNTVETATSRLSSNSPNLQNYPKRNPTLKVIRKCMKAPQGWVFLSFDYGQIEARVIAMASQDTKLVEAQWTDYDIHMHWAERIAKKYPRVVKGRYGDLSDVSMKRFRSDVKNQFVFPLFFGSSLKSAARNLELEKPELAPIYNSFWNQFKKVKAWQDSVVSTYEKRGYVENLIGRRRHGPIDWNQIINTPIQSLANDIAMDACRRLVDLSWETATPWLAPLILIHDDLTFLVPLDEIDSAVTTISTAMMEAPFDFINVPILVECEKGHDWYDMQKVAEFNSRDDLVSNV